MASESLINYELIGQRTLTAQTMSRETDILNCSGVPARDFLKAVFDVGLVRGYFNNTGFEEVAGMMSRISLAGEDKKVLEELFEILDEVYLPVNEGKAKQIVKKAQFPEKNIQVMEKIGMKFIGDIENVESINITPVRVCASKGKVLIINSLDEDGKEITQVVHHRLIGENIVDKNYLFKIQLNFKIGGVATRFFDASDHEDLFNGEINPFHSLTDVYDKKLDSFDDKKFDLTDILDLLEG